MLFNKFLKIEKMYELKMCKLNLFGLKISFKLNEHSILKPLNYKNIPHKKVAVSIVAILKNEAPYIKEWIEYHKLIGVDRFYLYDNESDDGLYDILKPYIEDGTVIYKYVEGHCMQIPVYNDAIYRYKDETEWLAIIDLDEFIVPIKYNSIKEVLNEYSKYSGLAVNCISYDSNGYLTKPDLLTIEAYTNRRKDLNSDRHIIKSIVKPKDIYYNNNPHCCKFKRNKIIVDSSFTPCPGALTKDCNVDVIRINHYHSRSLEEYKARIDKGFADQTNLREFSTERYKFEGETVTDDVIYKYLDKLKQKIAGV